MKRLLYIPLFFLLIHCSSVDGLRSYKQGEVLREVPGNTQLYLDFYDERPAMRVGEVSKQGDVLVYTEPGLKFIRTIDASEVAQIRVEKDEGVTRANLAFSGMSLMSGLSMIYLAPMIGTSYAETAVFYGIGTGFTGHSMVRFYEMQANRRKVSTIRVND